MSQFGVLSVLPPLVTILLAIFTKNVFLALFVGIFLGYGILDGGAVFSALSHTLNGIVKVFASSGNTIVIFSILLIGAIIYIIEKSGGINGFVDLMVHKKGIIKSKRVANFFTWLLGCIVFTSGSLSTMVVGSICRPVNDALKVPHEKAAFVVHTTSTPICVLLPFSGWMAAMVGYLVSGGVPEKDALGVLFNSIGMNFYCLLAVFGCIFICLANKDFGPMKTAEIRADTTGELDDPKTSQGNKGVTKVADSSSNLSRPMNLVLPILALILAVIVTLYVTGNGNLTKGSGMQALLWGVFVSLTTCAVLTMTQKLYTFDQFIAKTFEGASGMLAVAAILVLAFALSPVIKQLGTGLYLSSVFKSLLTPMLLPLIVFIIGCMISFSTGTSMGTMAIMAVIALPMALDMNVNVTLVAGAIWSGAIFGDHISPISDTTIMTCATTGCNVMDHVKTQAPYCLLFAVISCVLFVLAGMVL